MGPTVPFIIGIRAGQMSISVTFHPGQGVTAAAQPRTAQHKLYLVTIRTKRKKRHALHVLINTSLNLLLTIAVYLHFLESQIAACAQGVALYSDVLHVLGDRAVNQHSLAGVTCADVAAAQYAASKVGGA